VRNYEIVVAVRADLAEEELTAQIDTIKGWVTSKEGKIVQADHWGRRRLAYPIKKQREGYYILLKAELPPTAPAEIERSLRLNENVLRFLVILQDD
jgi:small subunit ribosomal protein S6